MKPLIVGICGGSGAGKTTLSKALVASEPDIYTLLHLDDYLKKHSEVPLLEGRENWDDPGAIDFDAIVRDLTELKAGKKVVVRTKDRSYNPHYDQTHYKTPIEVRPRPVVLIEGFLVLYDPRVRTLLDRSIWLEAAHEKRWSRRAHEPRDPEYEQKFLLPMFRRFVEPTKQFADIVIHTEGQDREAALREAEAWLQPILAREVKKLL